MKRIYTVEEVASWPDGHKRCRQCHEVLLFSEFHKQSNTTLGLNDYCKTCRKPKSKNDYWAKPLEKVMWERAKTRAKAKGLEFSITIEDIYIPEYCPVFNRPLIRGDARYAPSLDRIDSTKGYTPENIKVISTWANTLKGDATPWEIRALHNYMSFLLG